MPDEKPAEKAAEKVPEKAAAPTTPPSENKPTLVAQKTEAVPAAGATTNPVTALSPDAKKIASEKPKAGDVKPPPVSDRPSILADDLVDLLLFKKVITVEDVAALADPSIGGTIVHRADRLRPRFDPEFSKQIDKAREARRVRAELIAGGFGAPPKLDRSDEELGELADATPAAFFRPASS